MKADRILPPAAGLTGAVIGVVLVLATIGSLPPVQVTEVWWSSASLSNQTGPPGGCLAGMPRSTGGVSAGTSSWINVSTILTAAPGFVGSCYVFEFGVEPSGFVYANPPVGWFSVNGSVPVTLAIFTPATPFGPAPIYVTVYTSTSPGCMGCG